MGLITGGVVSAAALGLLSQWSLDRSGKPAQNDSADIADSQAQDSPDTGTSLQSGAVPTADTDEAETTSQSDDAMADDAAGAEPDAEQEATTAPATDDDAVSADDTASEPTEDATEAAQAEDAPATEEAAQPVEDTAQTDDAAAEKTSETEAETVAEQDDTSTTETGSETTGADVVVADAPANDTAEADSQDQPTTDEITSEQTAEAETIPEDPNANAPVPDVSQSIGQSTPQDATQLTAPTVTDRATGEAVAVTTSIRRTGEPAPEAPTAEGQPAVSTTPATRPVEDAPEEAVAEAEPEQDTATPAPEETSEAEDAAANEDTDNAADADQTADAEAAPMIGTKGGDLKSLTPEIKINRLPTLGQSAEPETDATETAQATPVADDPDLPVLQRYATAFENPENKPLMSIVLMDQGTVLDGSDVGVEALNQFPHPVTLAVDSSLPDAAERMKRYRDAGFEVMATVDLPEGFTAQDTEVSMSVILDDLPEVIGILEGVGTGIQSNRTVSLQVASILAQTGHGLITQDKGLNTGTQVAERAGVPVQGVFRDIDSKNQTAVVIRRFLDNAAFKAGQEDGIVLLGRVRPDTISALLLWGLRDRAERVAIAPASTVLLNR
jgi:polysaccharide deacetylase 2 family uncharacterized protein YibQ